ncbi:META domain-containing protein [Flavobacterium sp. 7A]|uniref:META domain-containing protein n=1 Tax=Flavobacterium sp. 7A TaxID=2940571 RepID=UPI002225C26B|nr:META domain-containing protein [Flavobacterium sp. 7A]MCW2119639.1 heat shock protein HslJ [Flavobacterium sp. 7A]
MMKKQTIFLVALITVLIVSCATKKNSDSDKLYSTNWELEYITGPRIAFKGLYPDRIPKITFDKTTNRVTGNNSCNSYSANYILKEDSIFFGEPGPTTLMFCGQGETVFMNMINKINKYSFDQEGRLILMYNDITMMRFKKTDN